MEKNTPEGRGTVIATRGFKTKLAMMMEDDSVSTKDIVSLLILQPFVMALLLRVANDVCEKNRFSKPTTAAGIVNIFGLVGIAQQFDLIEEVSPDQETVLKATSIDAYAFAKVLAVAAENRIGKKWAPEYFLVGLLHQKLKEDEEMLLGCNEDMVLRFKGEQQNGPALDEIRELTKSFRSNRQSGTGKKDCPYTVWADAVRYARSALYELDETEIEN